MIRGAGSGEDFLFAAFAGLKLLLISINLRNPVPIPGNC